MTRSRDLTTALLLALGLAACEMADTLGLPTDELAGDPLAAVFAEAAATVDARADSATVERRERERRSSRGGALFERLAAEIPGFGGLYRTARCAVAIVLTEDADKEHALRVVHTALEHLVGRACPDGIRLEVVRGQFTYVELHRFLQALRPLLRVDGVYGARIDYQQNRIVITVAGRRVADRVLEALPRVGVPVEAVVFEVHERGGRDTTVS